MAQEAVQITTTPPLPGLQLVQDLNKALQTLATDFSGSTDPAAIAWPYSTWADTGTGTLKRRNAANSAWVIEGRLLRSHLPMFAQADVPALDIGPIYIIGKGPAEWVATAYKVLMPDFPTDSDLQWLGTPIGGYITPCTAPPTNDPRFRYIYCDAGQATTGKYNDGVLINETVIGAAPLIEATAVVNLPASPFHGQTVHLINTEGRYVGAGVGEAVENDMLQNITGSFGDVWGVGTPSGSGALFRSGGSSSTLTGGGSTNNPSTIGLDASRVVRAGNRTQPRTHRLPYYRRIL